MDWKDAKHALSGFYLSISFRGSSSGDGKEFFALWQSAGLAKQLQLLIHEQVNAINAGASDAFVANWPITLILKAWTMQLTSGLTWPPPVEKNVQK